MNEVKVRWLDHSDGAAMAVALAETMAAAIQSAIDARGVALVALSGGNTPWPTYERLAQAELPWDRVVIIPSDDRLVAIGDPLSNVSAMTRIFEPLGARVEALTDPDLRDPVEAGRVGDQRIRALPWPVDFVLLGVGGDGHTASIFPGPNYAAALDPDNPARVVGVVPDPLPPEAPVARVSLSLAAIAAARTVAVAVTRLEKRAVVEEAIAGADNSRFPIGRVLAAIRTGVDVYWAPQ